MTTPPFSYDSESHTIRVIAPELLSDVDIASYFVDVTSRWGDIRSAHEVVDFRNVKECTSNAEDFARFQGIWRGLVAGKIITSTTFLVSNDYQQHMAEGYVKALSDAGVDLEIIFKE
ncbi:MAG: hypothetical protein ABUK11_01355 [Mariprofundaceae bacterium]